MVTADTFSAGRSHERAVDLAEAYRVVTEFRTSQDVPLGAMGAGTVQVAHLLKHARRRPGEQALPAPVLAVGLGGGSRRPTGGD